MSTRRDAREWSVQLLFQLDLNPTDRLDEVFEAFWAQQEKDDNRGRTFTEKLVTGVRGEIGELDGEIKSVAEHWDIGRMGVIERNVIRMALFEFKHHKDVPPAVVINEAVDLTKYYSSADSGKFVNGILDRMRKNLKLAAR